MPSRGFFPRGESILAGAGPPVLVVHGHWQTVKLQGYDFQNADASWLHAGRNIVSA